VKVKFTAEKCDWIRKACADFQAERISTVNPPKYPAARIIEPDQGYITLKLDHYYVIDNKFSTQYIIYSHDTIERLNRKYRLLVAATDYGNNYCAVSFSFCSSNEIVIRIKPGEDDGVYGTNNAFDVIASLRDFAYYDFETLGNNKRIIKEKRINLITDLKFGYDEERKIVYARYDEAPLDNSSNSDKASPS